MDIEQLQTQDIQTLDTSTLFPDLTSQLAETMAPFLMISVAISVVFAVLYITSALRRRKVEKAILDIQKTLHEMNERDKARTRPTPPIPEPKAGEEIIAAKPREL